MRRQAEPPGFEAALRNGGGGAICWTRRVHLRPIGRKASGVLTSKGVGLSCGAMGLFLTSIGKEV